MKNKIKQLTAIALVFSALGLSVVAQEDGDTRSGQTVGSGGFMGSGGLIGSGTAFDNGGFMGSGGRSADTSESVLSCLPDWLGDIF